MKVSIRVKIFGISLVLLLFLTLVGSFALYRIGSVREELDHVADANIPVWEIFHDIETDIYSEEILFLQVINELEQSDVDITRAGEYAKQYVAIRDRVLARMKEAVAILQERREAFSESDVKVLADELRVGIQQIEKEHDDYFSHISKVVQAYAAGEKEQGRVLKLKTREERDDFLVHLRTLEDKVRSLISSSSVNARDHEREVRSWTWILILLAALIGGIAAYLISSGLVRPLIKLVAGARDVTGGNLDVDLEVSSHDEVGNLTESFNEMTEGLRTKERIKETFGKYLDPRIVKNLLEDKSSLSRSGKEELMTVFFSDIKGFTPIAENLEPKRLVSLLNDYLTVMSDSIKEKNGVIDKYIGDAIMAFWGQPFSESRLQADAACDAALDNLARLVAFRRSLPALLENPDGLPDFSIRVGLATGSVVVGSIGSTDTKSYTIIGDTVNLAARLESMNKQYGTSILLSQHTYDMLEGRYLCREIDALVVMGKQQAVSIYELVSRRQDASSEQEQLCQHFAEALKAYRAQQWEAAVLALQSCLSVMPGDGPSRVFLERIEAFRENPPPADWDGVWVASKK